MTHRRRRRKTVARGFTLLEMMAVLVIIALFGSLVGVYVVKQIGKARVGTAKTQIKGFDNAIELFNMEKGRWPTEEEGLPILIEDEYLKGLEVPKDPWGFEYEYRTRTTEDGTEYIVICYGNDGQPGGGKHAADLCSSHQNLEDWLGGG